MTQSWLLVEAVVQERAHVGFLGSRHPCWIEPLLVGGDVKMAGRWLEHCPSLFFAFILFLLATAVASALHTSSESLQAWSCHCLSVLRLQGCIPAL